MLRCKKEEHAATRQHCLPFSHFLWFSLSGELRFASYYGDHMVLQKSPEKAVLWGYGTDNVTVVVNLSGLAKRDMYKSVVSDGE